MERGCISNCEGECTCPKILTQDTWGQPVVRFVDGFVHIHLGVREYVLSPQLAEEVGLALIGNAGLALRGFSTRA